MHIRAASSISSLKQVALNVADSPSAGKKPESSVSRKPKSKRAYALLFAFTALSDLQLRKSTAASEDFDDSISVADSAVSHKIRRNESERIEYYKNQPECGKAEPHSALCSKCNKSVNLGRKQTYAVRPWEIHRARCDQKSASAVMCVSVSLLTCSNTDVLHQDSSESPRRFHAGFPSHKYRFFLSTPGFHIAAYSCPSPKRI